MVRLLLILFLAICIVSIKKNNSIYPDEQPDSLLYHYIVLVKTKLYNNEIKLKHTPFYYNKMTNLLSLSAIGTSRVSEIRINREFFLETSDENKEALILHEYTHQYSIGHDERIMIDGCPYSVMYPRMEFDGCFNYHREHYYAEAIFKIVPSRYVIRQ